MLPVFFVLIAWPYNSRASAASPPALSQECRQRGFTRAPLILIGLDGFHPDLLAKPASQYLKHIKSKGVSSSYMRPVYPTKTFPNLYSIVTGLYPESHGIVENHFKDPDSGTEFYHTKNETYDKIKWGGEPIWVTAKKNGINYAVKHWPGSSVNFNGIGPNEFSTPGRTNYRNNVDQIISYMQLPEDKRPGFITLYYNEPDHTMHRFGPTASQVEEAIQKVSVSLKLLFDKLFRAKIVDCVNIIIVSDHGMAPTQCSGLMYLDELADLGRVSFLSGPSVMIEQFKSQYSPKEIFDKIRCRKKQDPVYEAYLKQQFPTRHHYSNNKRIGDVLVKMKEGHNMFRYSGRKPECEKFMGGHGYDDGLRSMQGIFIAYGAHFKKGGMILPFQNIELYNLMAALLGIEPAPNNGTYGLLADALTIEYRPRDVTQSLQKINYYGFASTKDPPEGASPQDGGYFSSEESDSLVRTKRSKGSKRAAAQQGDYHSQGADDYYGTGPNGNDVKVLDPADKKEEGRGYTNMPPYKAATTSPASKDDHSANDANDSDLRILEDTDTDDIRTSDTRNKNKNGAPKIDVYPGSVGSTDSSKCCSPQGMGSGATSFASVPTPTTQNYINQLAPFEIPKSDRVPISVLPDKSYIIGYDNQNNYPLWVSYLGKSPFVKQQSGGKCISLDPRIQNSIQSDNCQVQGDLTLKDGSKIIPMKLYSSDTNVGNVLTNTVYVYEDFYNSIWAGTMDIFGSLAVKRSANVIIGPVFDTDGDGLLDPYNNIPSFVQGKRVLIPSHIFIMILYCKNQPGNNCGAKDVVINSFVIPHRKEPENCESVDQYFRKYYARVKDIELLTGLKLFTKYPENDRIKLITHLPLNLNK